MLVGMTSKFAHMIYFSVLLLPILTLAREATLYDRLGGAKGVDALSSAFIYQLSHDARLGKNAGVMEIKKQVPELEAKRRLSLALNHATGGPAKSNRAALMKGISADVDLGAREWFYVIQDANQTMDERKIGAKERKDLLTLLLRAKDQ